jgi:hypothetical protein
MIFSNNIITPLHVVDLKSLKPCGQRKWNVH